MKEVFNKGPDWSPSPSAKIPFYHDKEAADEAGVYSGPSPVEDTYDNGEGPSKPEAETELVDDEDKDPTYEIETPIARPRTTRKPASRIKGKNRPPVDLTGDSPKVDSLAASVPSDSSPTKPKRRSSRKVTVASPGDYEVVTEDDIPTSATKGKRGKFFTGPTTTCTSKSGKTFERSKTYQSWPNFEKEAIRVEIFEKKTRTGYPLVDAHNVWRKARGKSVLNRTTFSSKVSKDFGAQVAEMARTGRVPACVSLPYHWPRNSEDSKAVAREVERREERGLARQEGRVYLARFARVEEKEKWEVVEKDEGEGEVKDEAEGEEEAQPKSKGKGEKKVSFAVEGKGKGKRVVRPEDEVEEVEEESGDEEEEE
ncbi:Hypothetical protein D9617_4g001160 [Elsinoe fawcettii]|nr:Hypothetical protein D9617_4g001160 [Elsinoe fawcettii]